MCEYLDINGRGFIVDTASASVKRKPQDTLFILSSNPTEDFTDCLTNEASESCNKLIWIR
jgi:hypothetical protein